MLSQRRAQLGWTLEEAGTASGLHHTAIRYIDQHLHDPYVSTVDKYARGLGMSAYYLTDREQNHSVCAGHKAIGRRLHEYRENHGISIRGLERIVGLNRATLCAAEHGKSIRLCNLFKIARSLHFHALAFKVRIGH